VPQSDPGDLAAAPAEPAAYPSDEAIMRALQEGHLDLLGTLFARYGRKVFARCFQLVGDRHEADDLVQESFLRVLRHRATFRATARFSTWLYRLVTNLCLDHLRARGRAVSAQRELAAEAALADHPPPDDGRLALVREALAQMAPEKRELLVMLRIRGFGYAELAAEAGVTVGAMRVRVHRAMEELKSIVTSLQEGAR